MNEPRILIIDDDPGLRKTLADILRAKGYAALAAGSGAEGLELLAQNPVHLSLIDLGLPDGSGIDLLHRLKSEHPSTEAIILTGNATLDSAIEATNGGAFSYLVKPYDIDHLMVQVQKAIEKRRAGEEIASRSAELERFNAELQALYAFSSTIGRTIDLEELLPEIMNALAETELLPFRMRGALFLVEDGEVTRASFIRLPEDEAAPCRRINPGECFCGLAAATGEIVVSEDCRTDPRHTVCNPCVAPHGRIVVPLRAADKVVGVLTLYAETGAGVGERTLHLLSTIGSRIGTAIENARLYEETKNSSLHDALTGIANRRFMEIQLTKAFESARRYGEALSAIMLDIDRFKSYNDTRGHSEGDRLLARLAEILMRNMRCTDYAFRYGGEEFLVILPRTDLDTACEVAERLRKTIETEAGCTVSLGVASFSGAMREKGELIEKADTALYRAKRNGRNRVESIE